MIFIIIYDIFINDIVFNIVEIFLISICFFKNIGRLNNRFYFIS